MRTPQGGSQGRRRPGPPAGSLGTQRGPQEKPAGRPGVRKHKKDLWRCREGSWEGRGGGPGFHNRGWRSKRGPGGVLKLQEGTLKSREEHARALG